MKVKVYWNLHKRMYSVVDMATGRVAFHTHALVLTDAKFRVQPAGRRKVLESGVKNVHAYVTGTAWSWCPPSVFDSERTGVTYNPFKFDSFVRVDAENTPVLESRQVWLTTAAAADGKTGKPWMEAA